MSDTPAAAVTPRIPVAQFKHLKARWKPAAWDPAQKLQTSLLGALVGLDRSWMWGFCLGLALLLPGAAHANFADCDLLSGQPVSCGGTFDGFAVVEVRGAYRECHFREGKATRCDKPYDGRSVVPVDGIYQLCDVADGRVARCVGWAQGRAPVWSAAGAPVFPAEGKGGDKPKPPRSRFRR